MTACFDFKTEWKHTNIKFVMKMTNFTNTCKKYNSWWKWLMFICQCLNCISYSSSGSISWFFKKENIYMHELNVNQIWYVVFFHELLVDYKKILLWNVYIYIHVLVYIFRLYTQITSQIFIFNKCTQALITRFSLNMSAVLTFQL